MNASPIAPTRFRAWLTNDGARQRRVGGFHDAGDELVGVLEDLGDAENYERWIVSLTEQHLGRRVLEVGAGSGNLTRRLAEGREVTAVEPHGTLYDALERRFAGSPDVRTFNGSLADLGAEGAYDSALMVNVLEHIDDDTASLREMRAAVRPGGHVAVFSPAFEALYSDFDCRVGHVRRYSRATLGDRFTAAGLDVVSNRYVNLPGFFGWLLIARMLKQNPTDPRRVETYDKRIVPWVRKLEDRVTVPFGQSVLTIGRRVDAPTRKEVHP